mgnify:CR=1 FL=1
MKSTCAYTVKQYLIIMLKKKWYDAQCVDEKINEIKWRICFRVLYTK